MARGYAGKTLWVDLSMGKIKEEELDEKLCHDFIGGYGLAARLLYSRQKGGVDPLGPENILGLVTGPLTASPAPTGCRYVAVAKSPLTGGWGDANSGGDWGPYLKFAGYDAVFFSGISPKPVYLYIENGKAQLKDARHLWGKDSYLTEDMLIAEHGKGTYVSCIGQSGESLSLISCIITKRGAAAGRSGLGAVMGSKKLKAVAVKGNLPVEIADKTKADELRREKVKSLQASPTFEQRRKYGTAGHADQSAHSGDTPVKNWGGVGVVDFPNVKPISGDIVIANKDKSEGCWHCPLACQALMKEGTEYKYPAGTRRPEYETLGSFGTMCLNNNAESIIMANHICNAYGLDTISAGTAIAFAIECYENGLISREDTGGVDLRWGNHKAIIAMTEKMAKREGIGDALADGVKMAAQKIGHGADKFAVHIGGEELGMHDPKLIRPGQTPAARYLMDATPGRHTAGFGPSGFVGAVFNSAGLCSFGGYREEVEKWLGGFLSSVTGWNWSMSEIEKAGERILTMRHVFNLREGINPLKTQVHPRILGDPPQKEGPLAGIRSDIEAQVYWNLGAMDWDRVTTKPSKKKLLSLGLNDVAQELWP